MLSVKALSQLRALANRLYPDRATIFLRPESDAGDYGQESSGAETVFISDEPCRFYPTKARINEALTPSQVQEKGDFTSLYRADLPRPPASARIEITSNGTVFNFYIAGFGDSSDKINTVIYLNRGNPPVIE